MHALLAICGLFILQVAQCSNLAKRVCYLATVNDATVDLITNPNNAGEGFRGSLYNTDSAHKWTVGYRHLCI
jgi:hypothetical protein